MLANNKKLLHFHSDLFSIVWVSGDRLLDGFEPIVDSRETLERIADPRIRKKYIFPFILTISLIGETFYQLATSGYNPDEPFLFHHIVVAYLPVFFRIQNDIICAGSLSCMTVFYSSRIFDQIAHAGVTLTYPTDAGILVTLNGQRINRSLSTKLARFWRKTKLKLRYLTYLVEFGCNFAFTYPTLVIEIYRISVGIDFRSRYIICGLLSGLFLHYVAVAIEASLLFIINNIYLNIKQRYYLQKMRMMSYKNYEMTLRTLLNHTEEIRLLNNFFSLPITASIVGFGFTSGSLLNGALNSPEVSLVFLVPWVAFAVFYLGLIAVFTATSSNTIDLNRKLYLKLQSLQASICTLKTINTRRRIVHLELVNEYKGLLLKTCFRLITSTPLNNWTFFFEFLTMLSIVYMKTTDRNQLKCDPICLRR